MPQTLLLADDSTTIQRVIELTFANEDIKVVTVSDGDQAIAQLQSAPPDIVLADVGMPGKTGYEVAEYIKQTPKLAHIPVVLLTGAFEPVDQAKAEAAGCDGVLAKPFEPQIVIGRVRELLGRAATSAGGKLPATVDKPVSNVFDFAPAASPEPASTEPASPEPDPEPQVEDYFDRLDAAFKTLSNAPAAAPADISLAPPVSVVEAAQDFAIADAFAAEPARGSEPPPIRVSAFVPEPEPPSAAEPEPEPIRLAPAPEPIRVARAEPEPEPEPIRATVLAPQEPPEPVELRAPRGLPSIADAFAAILSAEQNALGVKPEWPSPASQSQAGPAAAAPAAPAELVITDDLIDRVARRVLEQMSDRVVRETVADIASQTAERLVREEIERIKASAK